MAVSGHMLMVPGPPFRFFITGGPEGETTTAPVSETAMTGKRSLVVSIVDDDESVRESLPDLIRQFGFAVGAFSSAEAFLLASDVVSENDVVPLRHRDARPDPSFRN